MVYVLFGGIAAMADPWLAVPHLAAVGWAGMTMFGNLGCPVTDWEKTALRRAGDEPYPEGFLQHHVLRRRFDASRARRNHAILGAAALALNVAIYAAILMNR